ncbi:1-deoxy-D-xylulose-5-phosphate synthase [Shewanella insulae]|uniref:1-deoxy-D-xylulose-5-phosphate synthase n=1 Tax=Shewanella insulae TaxID=2681496 RepID=UPI001EFD13A6|nr:1-deoxy-D-xylulose-5-phosphate synthase [Shewanella insulae]MCG9755910.1 1-deoxy-D-xylulose-5-phosphate synthase [Shewanella insulae]
MKRLNAIQQPNDIKQLTESELVQLASEIRHFLIDSISQTGGHIGANLGVIELTIALHHAFNIQPTAASDGDSILFDVGHQGYTHKLLTGRMAAFDTLNQMGGMSRFVSNHESEYDLMEASHAGTAIPIACGLAFSKLQNAQQGSVLAFIGDGSMVEGMAFEGLNFSAEYQLPLFIVINDNGMSIPPNVGGLHNLFSAPDWQRRCANWFEGMGFGYVSIDDGHDMSKLLEGMEKAQQVAKQPQTGPVVIHVKTEKGRGLALAHNHPYKLHFSMPFNPETGEGVAATLTGKTYQGIVGDALMQHMEEDETVYALTPATPYASGVEALMKAFPKRAIDVGMAEQHAVGMAAGLAMAGNKVFMCFQSTFMQRAWDQLFHDICFPKHPVTVISARSGFAGFDGPTHHGIYDFGLLRTLPDIKIFYAGTARDLQAIMQARLADSHASITQGPMIVLHPYETVPTQEESYLPSELTPLEEVEIVCPGDDGLIIAVANQLQTAIALREKIMSEQKQTFKVVNLRWLKPLPLKTLVPLLQTHKNVISLEEGLKDTGIGVAINQLINKEQLTCDLLVSALEQGILPAGDKQTLAQMGAIDTDSVYHQAAERWEWQV